MGEHTGSLFHSVPFFSDVSPKWPEASMFQARWDGFGHPFALHELRGSYRD